VLISIWTSSITASDRRERDRTAAVLRDEEVARAAGAFAGSQWRGLYLDVRQDERARRAPCAASRFLSVVRDDEPMALQPPDMTNRSYYAGRDVESARRAGPMGPCDYIVTTVALQATEKGQHIVQALSGGAALETIEAGPSLLALRLR
jgi:hypothetical protein